MKVPDAKRCVAKEIVEGFYKSSESEFEPNKVITKDARVLTRVKMVGIAKWVSDTAFILYDGTGGVTMITFDSEIPASEVDNKFLQVVGKPYLSKSGKVKLIIEGFQEVPSKALAVHLKKVANITEDQIKKYEVAKEIYEQYGVSKKAIMMAKMKDVEPEILEAIDYIEFVKTADNFFGGDE